MQSKFAMRDLGRMTAVALTATAISFPALAQEDKQSSQAPTPQVSQEMRDTMKEYREVANQLREIQKSAVENNPELSKQREAFQSMMRKHMSSGGYEVEAARARLDELRSKMQDKSLSQEKRQKVVKQLRQEQQKLQQARRKAMQKQEVREAGKKLRQDTVTAMKAENEDTEALMQRMNKLRQELRSGMRKQRGGGTGGPE